MLREVTGSLRSQQEIILAGLDIQREATRQQIIAAKAEQERAIARERTRLKELLRGNAASGARGKKNRIRMENALANFRVYLLCTRLSATIQPVTLHIPDIHSRHSVFWNYAYLVPADALRAALHQPPIGDFFCSIAKPLCRLLGGVQYYWLPIM